MEREKFIKKFNEASGDIDEFYLRLWTNRSINASKNITCHDNYYNLIIVMEELSELQKEVSKTLRGKGDHFALIEEMADVLLGIIYLQEILNIPTFDLYKAMNVKMDRLRNVLESEGVYS